MFKRFLIAFAAAGLFGVLNAKTYYVNCQMEDYTKHDGSTPAKAFKTLQEAVDKCAKAGDTVLVAPGDYNHGARRMSGALPAWGKNVVTIDTKQVTIRSTDGAAVTFITGQHGSHLNAETGEPDGCGADTNDFVRCIATYNSATANSVIEGFTIRNGACLYSSEAPDHATNSENAGGIFNRDGGRLIVVDCVLSNNVGGSTAPYMSATFVRCKLVGHFLNGPASSPSMATDCEFLNCYIAHNRVWQNGIVASGGSTKLINVTMVDNQFAQHAYNAGTRICNCIINGHINTSSIPTVYSTVMTGENVDGAPYAVLAPPLDDYRVRLGSGAETLGDPEYLKELSLPDTIDVYLDIDGNEFSPGGAIAAGCCQTVVDPAAGGIFFRYGNSSATFQSWRVNGGPEMRRNSYVFPDGDEISPFHFEFISTNAAPVRPAYCRVPECTDPALTTYTTPCGRISNVYPEADGTLYLMPHFDKSRWLLLEQIQASTSVLYVDAKASQAGADGTAEHPFRTFKDAIESEQSGDRPVLLAQPGVYAEGEMSSPYVKSLNAKARIVPGSKVVTAVALEGPEKTTIRGAADPSSTTGCGDNAVRISISGGQINGETGQGGVLLNGFTLTGGYSATSKTGDTVNPTYWAYSGAMVSESVNALARNCIISNNVGEVAGAGHWVFYDRCRILGNRTLGNSVMLNNCYLTSSLIVGSPTTYFFNVDANAKALNCTFVGTDRSHAHYPNGSDCDRYNNIHITGTTPTANGDLGGNLYWNFVNVPQILEACVKDPLVLKPTGGDARLYRGSPAVTNGVALTTNNDWYLISCDLNGDPWRIQNGVIASGATQTVVTNGLYLAATSGGVAIDGQSGYFELEKGDEVTVEFVADSSRPVGSVVKNGEAHSLPLTITGDEVIAAGGMLVQASYTNVWYVDAVYGDDSNFGYVTNHAFRTLKRAMENANLLAGDHVAAMPGDYAEGSMSMPDGEVKPDWGDYAYPDYTIASRAIVPKNVTLESIYGREVTTISGQAASVPGGYVYSATDDVRGMGDDAMHALTLNVGARVKGFTITKGFSRMPRNQNASPDAANHADPDFCGGGVTAYYSKSVGARSQCWAEDCLFTNNASFRGGGVMAVNCKNCVFVDNVACYGGGAASDSKIYGCLSRSNYVHYPYKRVHDGFFYGPLIHNSTMLDGCVLSNSGRETEGSMRNDLIISKLDYSEFTPQALKYCIVNNDTSGSVPYIYYSVSNANHCIYTASDNLQLDRDYRPVLGANAAVDAGDSSLMDEELLVDASGIQRIYNNSLLDIGALEGDWRPVYTASISNSKRINVTDASPSVYNSFESVVRLPLDAEVVTVWTGESGKQRNYSCSARVSGNGTLIVTLNGEELGRIEGTGESSFAFVNDLAENTVVFAYTGSDGYAELLSTGRGGGSLIMCR